MEITFFLGSGFSVPFGHPTMNDFLGFADSCKRLTQEERDLLGNLVLESRRANSFLESSPTNIEDILSFAEMGERLDLTRNSGRREKLRTIIQKIYTHPSSVQNYWEKYKLFNSFLKDSFNEKKEHLSFITTNYDLNIESACFSLNSKVNPGFSFQRVKLNNINSLGHFYDPLGIPMFKLHGSVNWYPSQNDVWVDDHIVEIAGSWEEQRSQSLPYPCVTNYISQGCPLIIPPSFLKPDLNSALINVWRNAAKTLEKTTFLVFIGYSFPLSDTEMMYFLARSLTENSGLRGIYLIDPRADEIAHRLRKTESKMGSHFRNLLRPINQEWNLTSLPI